jgi:hypothetical protein
MNAILQQQARRLHEEVFIGVFGLFHSASIGFRGRQYDSHHPVSDDG